MQAKLKKYDKLYTDLTEENAFYQFVEDEGL